MEFSEYQKQAHKTADYPAQYGFVYTALGLAGEAGEVANKVKKLIRDRKGEITDVDVAVIIAELGDVQWYLAEMCTVLGVTLEHVARLNLDKLADRKVRGVIGGSGDNR